MASYIDNIIGIKGLHSSGEVVLLNSFDGISDEFIVNVADSDELTINQDTVDIVTTLSNIWSELTKRTERELETELRCELMKDVEYLDLIATTADEQLYDEYYFINQYIGKKYGVRFTANRMKHAKVNFKGLVFNSETSGQTKLYVYDTELGIKIHEQTFDYVAGSNIINVGKEYGLNKLRNNYVVAIDVNMNLSPLKGNLILSKSYHPYIEFKAGFFDETMQFRKQNFTDAENVLCLQLEITSNLQDIIKENIALFTQALGYKMAGMLLETSSNSDAINLHTNTNRAVRKELSMEYEHRYKKELERLTRALLLRLNNTPVIRSLRQDDMRGVSIQSKV